MKAPRIVLFGATGYTGRLTTAALVRRGLQPVVAGRNKTAIDALALELGVPGVVADVADPESVRALVRRGDVLISTVGPFQRWGAAAAEAAIAAGAHYLDSTGEPAFIRRVFEHWDAPARAAGIAMLPAFGYDYVPGNLAAGLALEAAGPRATSATVGYFTNGPLKLSGGTLASATLATLDPIAVWRDGKLIEEDGGCRVLRHRDGSRIRRSLSLSGTEMFALPRSYSHLRHVHVGLGWLGPFTGIASVATRCYLQLLRIPGARNVVRNWITRAMRGSSGGPGSDHNEQAGITVIAQAYSATGEELAHVQLDGPGIYAFTAEALAWSAQQLILRKVLATGALGPIEAFGLHELERGCASIGLRRRVDLETSDVAKSPILASPGSARSAPGRHASDGTIG